MEIINIKHAIRLTIERHQAVVDGKYEDFDEAKVKMKPDGWRHCCPLCEYAKLNCLRCPWMIFEDRYCKNNLVTNSASSIKRLNSWLQGKRYYSKSFPSYVNNETDINQSTQ
jgi:hypothetical protein